MKFQNFVLTTALVCCFSSALMVMGLGAGYANHDSIIPLFIFLLLIYPLLKKKTIVAALETDLQFYNRVICATAQNQNCLACFPPITRPDCTINTNCAWDELNNICYPSF
ncbi:hypothetical protein ACJMK2_022362 [Sinanodonta woodiana]|uniref:Uncharacterized protein n=1 Tax=Sinanodonta woodiana TaxID=1069815 RepID=A0ABD3TIY3_SINWO